MNIFKVLSIFCTIIVCISMLYGCGSDGNNGDLSMGYFPVTSDPQSASSNIELSVDNLALDNLAGTSTIQIKSDCDWSISFRESSNNKEDKELEDILRQVMLQ